MDNKNETVEQATGKKTIGGTLPKDTIIPLARKAAAEGIVLLKNNGTLPIKTNDTVALFGRTAINYFAVGYGSGGDVQSPYIINIIDGLKGNDVKLDEKLLAIYEKWTTDPSNIPDEGSWGNWPMNFPEMPLDNETVKSAAKMSDVAIIVIGRAAGEDRENLLEKGSYYLTDLEIEMLDLVIANFDKVVVVMDCGNIIDMAWTLNYGDKIDAIIYAWQGGMEGGNAVADVLTGRINPCGKLPDSIAISYDAQPSAKDFGNMEYNNYTEDIYVGYRYFETFAPEKVLYPFGFGLSYTTFEITTNANVNEKELIFDMDITVKNTGEFTGKEAVSVYVSAPQGKLEKPKVELIAFKKTSDIKPGDTESINLPFTLISLASYDDSGASGYKSAFVLEKGEYIIYVGNDCKTRNEVCRYTIEKTIVTQQLSEVMAVKPENVFKRLVNNGGEVRYEDVPTSTTDLKSIILTNLPAETSYTGDIGLKPGDVKSGKCSLEQFIAQLTPEELDDISHGEGNMDSALGVTGNAGAFGGITESLRDKGIPPVITADGPAGIRLKKTCSLLPCGTALAATFDTGLVSEVFAAVAEEMKYYGVNVLLAPGMNIHRNPLCGRNFEYFSEDPYLSGKMGVAVVNGVQKGGVSCSPKHFACNNQEMNRIFNDSRVSERALREIYLKGFEIMVKESDPHMIMTSYNKINGVWSHYSYELVTTVLRDEWGYEGLIITDWWMRSSFSQEFPDMQNDAYRVRAQVDVLMPGGDSPLHGSATKRNLLDTYGQPEGITLGELQRTARNVLKYILRR